MSKFWRIALAWLLAVALPIQGYAATTMLLCGPAHHQSSATHDHAMHEHGDAAMGHDGTGAHGEATEASPTPGGDKAQTGKCSVCSSCCNAAAITASVVAPAVVSPDLPEVVPVLIAEERVIIGGLERPPRHSRI
ncbi:MAG: hypothetical protein IV092_10550 [Burkholderiaceae bacterium]|nr:hypothetical protein [Burkholderiaceae bacterium]